MGPTELGPTGLKDIHKECLRLAGRHYSSKEIARLLGISKHTVDQRLRFATRQMGAASRFEAARRFCDDDIGQIAQRSDLCDPVLYDTAYIPVNADGARDGGPGREKDLLSGTASSKLHDAQTPYMFGDASKIEALFSVPVPTGKAPSSPLSLRAKSVIIVGIAAISLLAFAAAIAALEVLSRI